MAGARLDPKRPGINTLKQMMTEAFHYNSDTESDGHTAQFANTLLDLVAAAINLQKASTHTSQISMPAWWPG